MKEFPSIGAKLQDYEAFIATVDTGNLTRAAARLRRSLQSVSRSLTALEQQLGVELVRRTTRQARPTEAGMAFYRRIAAASRDRGRRGRALRHIGNVERNVVRRGLRLLRRPLRRSDHSRLLVATSAVKFDLRISEQFAEPIRTRSIS